MEPLMDLDEMKLDFDLELDGLPWTVLRVLERGVKGAVRVVGGYAVLLVAAGATFTALRLADALARRSDGKTKGWAPKPAATDFPSIR
jgi:hypothetical protein